MRKLLALAAAVTLCGCTPMEQALWERWHAVDPYTAEQYTEDTGHTTDVLAALEAQLVELEALPRCALYDRWLDAAGLPVHFHAVMRRETGNTCDPNAHNPSGATGLLQIMPMWADDCGGTPAMLYDPRFNIDCGVHVYEVQGGQAWQTW